LCPIGDWHPIGEIVAKVTRLQRQMAARRRPTERAAGCKTI
jgi:hypothetical protein